MFKTNPNEPLTPGQSQALDDLVGDGKLDPAPFIDKWACNTLTKWEAAQIISKARGKDNNIATFGPRSSKASRISRVYEVIQDEATLITKLGKIA